MDERPGERGEGTEEECHCEERRGRFDVAADSEVVLMDRMMALSTAEYGWCGRLFFHCLSHAASARKGALTLEE